MTAAGARGRYDHPRPHRSLLGAAHPSLSRLLVEDAEVKLYAFSVVILLLAYAIALFMLLTAFYPGGR